MRGNNTTANEFNFAKCVNDIYADL